MNKAIRLFSHPFTEGNGSAVRLGNTFSRSTIHIANPRVAQLLLVLHELDESMAELQGLPKTKLNELVCGAIEACGFVDPVETRRAIAAILDAIEAEDLTPPCS